MPELPDITVYVESLRERILERPIEALRLASPFLVRSHTPPIKTVEGKSVLCVERLGKRIVIGLDGDLFLVLHLMVSGRLHWKERGAKVPAKVGLCALDFPHGTLTLTEASSKKRASLHLVSGRAGLEAHQRGGLEVLDASLPQFRAVLLGENHTLKRSLTDPRLFSGIGNAYSDEILHAAKLSPLKLSTKLSEEEIKRLYNATRQTLLDWTQRLRDEAKGEFPEKVTAFRKEMAVHGKYKEPCPVCGAKVQRIVHAENETNYCATCQTVGKLLADRSLSKLLKDDWPKTPEELEEMRKPSS